MNLFSTNSPELYNERSAGIQSANCADSTSNNATKIGENDTNSAMPITDGAQFDMLINTRELTACNGLQTKGPTRVSQSL